MKANLYAELRRLRDFSRRARPNCAGRTCGKAVDLVGVFGRRGYRCAYCNLVFCHPCAIDHFGGLKRELSPAELSEREEADACMKSGLERRDLREAMEPIRIMANRSIAGSSPRSAERLLAEAILDITDGRDIVERKQA